MKKVKFFALALCLLMVCTVVLCACGNEEENLEPYEVANETEWKELILGTANFDNVNNANFTIEMKSHLVEDELLSENTTIMCADGLFYQIFTSTYNQYEAYYDVDGACGRSYNVQEKKWGEWEISNEYTSSDGLKRWRDIYSSGFDYLAGLFEEFEFVDGVYSANNLKWGYHKGGDLFRFTECHLVITKKGIKSIYGVARGSDFGKNEAYFSVEISNVGSTKITMPKI